jgi:hypothetical protein
MSEHQFSVYAPGSERHKGDAHEATSGTAYSHTAAYGNVFSHTNAAYRAVVGFRFLIDAPAGVTINAAYLTLTQASGGTAGAYPRGDINVENVPNPTAWAASDGATTSTDSPFDRWGGSTLTGTPVSWNHGSAGTNDVAYDTADFASLVQTVVDHANYDPADDAYRIVSVLVKGHNVTASNWRCHTVESSTSGYRPLLVLDYSAPILAPAVVVAVSLPESFFPAVNAGLPVTVTIPTPDINPITPQYLTGTGLASAEAHGTGVIGTGAINLAGAGLASAEAHGTGTVSVGAVNLAGTGLASGEVHGTGTVATGLVNVTGVGLTSSEAHGTGEVTLTSSTQNIDGTGLASAEMHGTGAISVGAVNLAGSGLASAEAHGTGTVTLGVTIVGAGLATAEAHGTGTVTIGAAQIVGAGLASSETHGTGTISTGAVNLTGTALASAEAHGLGQVVLGVLIVGAGLATAEAHGTGTVAVGAAPARRIRRSARRPDMTQSAREEGDG